MATEDTNPFEGFITESSRDGEVVEAGETVEQMASWDDEPDESNTENKQFEVGPHENMLKGEDDGGTNGGDEGGENDEIGEEGAEAAGGDEGGGSDGGGSADGPDVANGGDSGGEQGGQKRGRKSMQQRLGEVTEARRTAEAESAALKERARLVAAGKLKPEDLLDDSVQPQEQAAADPEPDLSDLKKPDPEDFKYGEIDSSYLEAVGEYNAEKAIRKREAKAEAKKVENARATEIEELQTAWVDNVVNPGNEEFKDFDDVVIKAAQERNLLLSPELGKLIAKSKQGAKIAYELGSDLEEAERVFNLSPMEQAAYFGRVEARFSSGKTDAGTKKSKAPKPVKKATGNGAGFKTNPATRNFADFERLATGTK